MTIDISRFHQVFFDEAAEHLATMESLLLRLDVGAPGKDDLNAIFRAAHSVKGGSGTFGFQDMTEVTHALETLLDRLRKDELQLSGEMIEAFLQAGDVLKAQLAAHRGQGESDAEDAGNVMAWLQRLATADASTSPAHRKADRASRALTIRFSPEGCQSNLDALWDNLRTLGTLEIVEHPPANEHGAMGTDLGAVADDMWWCRLITAQDEARVREVFEFVTTPDQVQIISEEHAFVRARASEPPAMVADPGYGLFEDAPGMPAAELAADPGYGFFCEIAPPQPAAPAIPTEPHYRSYGRRATDRPDAAPVPGGRRTTDKVAVAQGEASSIRVSVGKVDALINLVGELVITQAMLAQIGSQADAVMHGKLVNGLGHLERNTRDLQEAVMSIRMLPMSFVFSRFPRVVRDLAAKLGKQVELRTEGEATELDKGLIEKLADPLTHLVRNSLDHGIETPEARAAAGKPAKGTVTLKAFHRGGNIVIEVIDDGRGLDRERILGKARERGLQAADAMSDQEVYSLIFEAGFSTAETVTDVSGRGVGMDVVRRNIREMGGGIEIDSRSGAGTRISIRLPLTLAILDGMSIAVGREVFIIPLACITESLQPAARDITTVSGRGRVVQVRGEYLPVVALHEVFGIEPTVTEFDRGIMVILESEGVRTALFVDQLLGQHQVVIKSLEKNYRRVPGVSGATIMGDGRVALILDMAALTKVAQGGLARAA